MTECADQLIKLSKNIALPGKLDHRKTIAKCVGELSDGLALAGPANYDLSLKRREMHRPCLPSASPVCASTTCR